MTKPSALEQKKQTFTVNGLEEKYVRVFDSWIYKMGFRSRKAALMFLCHAMYDKRLFVMDRGTKEILVGAARDDTMAEARRIAREEARIVLWEEGFISDANL